MGVILYRKPTFKILLIHLANARGWCKPGSPASAGAMLEPSGHVRFGSDIVAKVENRTTLKISRKPMFRRFYAAILARPDTKVRSRFCVKRCGPSRRRVRTASAVLKNFVRQPEKTFSTVSVQKQT